MEVLQKCPLFSGFEGEEISILLGRAQPLRCKMKKGEKVPAGHLGLLLSGRLCIKGQAADSRSIQLNHVLPGAASVRRRFSWKARRCRIRMPRSPARFCS